MTHSNFDQSTPEMPEDGFVESYTTTLKTEAPEFWGVADDTPPSLTPRIANLRAVYNAREGQDQYTESPVKIEADAKELLAREVEIGKKSVSVAELLDDDKIRTELFTELEKAENPAQKVAQALIDWAKDTDTEPVDDANFAIGRKAILYAVLVIAEIGPEDIRFAAEKSIGTKALNETVVITATNFVSS